MSEQKNASLADQAYEQILALLFDQGFAGGEIGSTVSLAEKLGMSRTPVRMALARLESEGLIRQLPEHGWARVPITLETIEHIFDIMEALNPLLVRRAAEKITPEASAELLGIIDEMEKVQVGDIDTWLAVQVRYHDLLLRIVGNKLLQEALERLNHRWYHVRVGYDAMAGRSATSAREHQLIAKAIVAGDPDEAAQLTVEHLRGVRASVLNVVRTILVPLLGREL